MSKVKVVRPGNYDGYIWMSDKKEPKVLIGESFVEELDSHANPFIIEAQLYDAEQQLSYSIKYVDGDYQIFEWNLSSAEMSNTSNYTEVECIPNRMNGISRLKFRRYWDSREDSLCLNMKAPQPGAFVFVGFTNNTNQEEK